MSTIAVTNLKHESASGNNITLDSNENVGIGGSAPSTNKLHVTSTGQTRAVVYNSTNLVGVRIQAETSAGLVQTDTNHPLRFATNNGSPQLIIDTAGRVTMPYQPAFIAYIDSSVWQSYSGTVVPWSSTYFNVGSHFNTSTGVFTAPVAGLYLFNAQIYQLNATDNGQVWLRVNGTYDSRRRFSIVAEDATSDMTNNLTVIEKLNANDTIDLRVDGGLYTGHSRFSGCLLS